VYIALHTLVRLCRAPAVAHALAALNCVTALLRVLRDHEPRARRLAMEALRLLGRDEAALAQLVLFDALPLVLPCLYGDDPALLVSAVHVLALLADRCGDAILAGGGVPVLLSHLAQPVAGPRMLPLHIAVCEALTRMSQHDAMAM